MRAWARRALVECELLVLADVAVLVATELATNAVLHTRTPFRVTLSAEGSSGVRVEAFDNARPPVRAPMTRAPRAAANSR